MCDSDAMNSCHLCQSSDVETLLDWGPQPICNRFLSDRARDEYTYPLVMGLCNSCGLVQLTDPVPARELLAPFDWITYNEPEGHLDALTETLAALPGIGPDSLIYGISFKDDSTLDRLVRHGFPKTRRLDPLEDLDIDDARAGVETVQDRLTPEKARKLVRKRGLADLVIARHILEHAHNPRAFMRAVRELVQPDGYVMFEAPDCSGALETRDYTCPWEEHILYYTPETFRNGFASAGFALERFQCYTNPLEDSLVAVVRPTDNVAPANPNHEELDRELGRAHAYAGGLEARRRELDRFFRRFREQRGGVALFGAGHLACAFVNLLGLAEHFDFVADDHPEKQGMFMPGSRLPVLGSAALVECGIKLCLLSLSPSSEDRVIELNTQFRDRGGDFYSVFPSSTRALRTEGPVVEVS